MLRKRVSHASHSVCKTCVMVVVVGGQSGRAGFGRAFYLFMPFYISHMDIDQVSKCMLFMFTALY